MYKGEKKYLYKCVNSFPLIWAQQWWQNIICEFQEAGPLKLRKRMSSATTLEQ
jgi:hypothetical protein